MKQTTQTHPADNLGAILDGWLTTLRALAATGNPHAALWLPLITAEPTTGRRLARFSDLRVWSLGLAVEAEGAGEPPSVDDGQAQTLYRQLFGSH